MHNHTVPNLMETGSQVKGKGYALAGRLAPLLKPVHLEAEHTKHKDDVTNHHHHAWQCPPLLRCKKPDFWKPHNKFG
eukprot:3456651-Amphidinium_carterae.1